MKQLKKIILMIILLCLIVISLIYLIKGNSPRTITINNNKTNKYDDTSKNDSSDNGNYNIKNDIPNKNNINENITDVNNENNAQKEESKEEEKIENEITWNNENIIENNINEEIIKNTQWQTQGLSSEVILVEYENKKYNFKIWIPNTRAFQENTNWFNLKIKTPKNDNISENLGVTIQELQTEETMESFTKKTIEWLKNLYKNYKEIKREDVEINSIKGISITYEFIENWHNIKAKQTALLKGNKSYIFQYTAEKDTFDNYIDEINRIINSFTF